MESAVHGSIPLQLRAKQARQWAWVQGWAHFLATTMIVVVALLIAGPVPCAAQESSPPRTPHIRTAPTAVVNVKGEADKLKEIAESVSRLGAAAAQGLVPAFRMQSATDSLEASRQTLRGMVDTLRPMHADALKRLEQLGPPPQQGATESTEVAAERKRMADEAAAYDGLIKRAELVFVEAGQALAKLAEHRRTLFRRQLLQRTGDVGSWPFWQRTIALVPQHIGEAARAVGQWLSTRLISHPVASFVALAMALLAWLGLTRIGRRLLADDRDSSEAQSRNRAERGARTLLKAVFAAAPYVGAIGVFLGIVIALDVSTADEAEPLLRAFAYVAACLFLIAALSAALVQQRVGDMLVNLDPTTGSRLRAALSLLAVVWLADQLVSMLDTLLSSPLDLVTLHLVAASMLYLGLLAAILLVPIKRGGAPLGPPETNGWPPWLFAVVVAAAAAIFIAAVLGYVQLASFMASQFVATSGLVLLVTLIHLTAEYVSTRKLESASGDSRAAAPTVDSKVMSATLGLVLGIGLDLLVLLLGVPLLLLQWGYGWSTVRGWVQSAFFGFQFGTITISLQTLFVSITILVVGILATRLVARMLLHRIRMVVVRDSGAIDSVGAILTYAGFLASLLVALSYIGFSLSNIALVAGALSVGIGFGLQSIANNFVSGLILLAERPIKVGDWIVLGDQQGRVQKISVRSTEIRTFDRSTVIVPNADLITGRVVNWTHGDTLGRIVIRVGVSYGADPRKVLEILLRVGEESPMTLDHPKTRVVFEGFGDSSLDFTLRTYIRDVSDILEVQTELRLAIFEALKARDIEIPFPQRDVHIRSGLRQVGEPLFKRDAARE